MLDSFKEAQQNLNLIKLSDFLNLYLFQGLAFMTVLILKAGIMIRLFRSLLNLVREPIVG